MPEQTGDLAPKAPIRAAVYRGPTDRQRHDRGSEHFRAERMPDDKNFDERLCEQLERVQAEGRSELILLDIGSGDGGLFRKFLERPWENNLSRGFMYDNPNFRIRMVGMTDSPSPEAINTQKSVVPNETGLDDDDLDINRRIKVENIYWSLTRTQTLADFLQANQVGSVDLVTATESLRYLSVPVFTEVVRTTWDRLSPGGQFVAQGLSRSEPGIKYGGIESGFWETEASERDETLWKKLLRDNVNDRGTMAAVVYPPPFETFEEGREALDRAVEKYKSMGVLTDEEVKTLALELENRPEYQKASPNQRIMARANRILSTGFSRLRSRRDKEMNDGKLKALRKIVEPSAKPVLFRGLNDADTFTNAFILTKPASGGQNVAA
jgi:hypothetical protein